MREFEFSKSKVFGEDLNFVASKFIEKDELYDSTFLITGATGLIGVSIIRTLLYANEKFGMNIRVVALVRNLDKAKKYLEDFWIDTIY